MSRFRDAIMGTRPSLRGHPLVAAKSPRKRAFVRLWPLAPKKSNGLVRQGPEGGQGGKLWVGRGQPTGLSTPVHELSPDPGASRDVHVEDRVSGALSLPCEPCHAIG